MSRHVARDMQQLRVFLLELRADLNRMNESIQQMQRRTGQLLSLFQQQEQDLSEQMYLDLERAIREAASGSLPSSAGLQPVARLPSASVSRIVPPVEARSSVQRRLRVAASKSAASG